MVVHLVWSPQARMDLLELYRTIALEQPAAADRYFDRIEELSGLLVQQPRLGVRRRDIRPTTRILIERPYLILYEHHPDSDSGPVDRVEIVRIVDGRRDLANLF